MNRVVSLRLIFVDYTYVVSKGIHLFRVVYLWQMSWGWSNWLSDWDEGTSTSCVIPWKSQTIKVVLKVWQVNILFSQCTSSELLHIVCITSTLLFPFFPDVWCFFSFAKVVYPKVLCTPPKFNMEPKNEKFGRCFSFSQWVILREPMLQ